ncbi:hypothetical protein ASPCAL13267 [Aspergillus calidoustus]|uniref:Uncharacterized protein n=1 Tax=Aspergillus calidoustus TaxID=454130 RepID=A0A0U5GH84_ASPCI|nr:hypothetical protein ASPCAL13267 [Aspergillus calidoustus]
MMPCLQNQMFFDRQAQDTSGRAARGLMKVRLNASGLSDVRRMQRRIPRVYILADNDLDEHFRGHGSAAHSHIDRCRSRVDWILFGKVAGSGGWCPGNWKPTQRPTGP